MIFNRKITLYLNDECVELDRIADLVCEQTVDWMASEERGQFEQVCQCGNLDCIDVEVQS